MGRRLEVVGACALDCPDACSWVVTVEEDDAGGRRAVSLRGNPEHPFTRGGLCAKVNSYLEYAASPRRLLHPLRRVGPKGSNDFEQISWDDALDLMASRVRDAVERHGGESVWPYSATGTISVLQGCSGSGARLFNTLGASRHVGNICSPAGHAGMGFTVGAAASMDPADLRHSGTIVLWGTNTLTSNLHLWPFVTQGRDAGAPLVVVDPVRTRTAARADLHLAPRPGTDGALALGVMAGLVARGAADEEYLAAHALGWEEFRDTVLARWSPQRAAEVCGLGAAEVDAFADLVAARRPLGIRTLMGVQRHGGAAAAVRLVSCLPAVTGDYGRLGGGTAYSTGRFYGFDDDAHQRPDLRPAGPGRGLVMSRLGRELLTRSDPPVQVLVVWAGNPVVSNPDQRTTRAGLAREDLFTVVVEHTLTDTTAYADLVLPGAMQHEQLDLVDSYSHLYVQLARPAVPPPGECLPHTEIFRRLAARLGITDPAVLASDEELLRAAIGDETRGIPGVTLESLQEKGFQRIDVPEPFLPFAETFPTPSGRFEFASATAETAGAGRLPDYRPPHEALGGLALVSAANHYLVNSTFTDSPKHARAGDPVVLVHPKDAAEAGVADGATVRVGNDRGTFVAVVTVTDAVRPGVAATTKGLSRDRFPDGSSVNATTSDALSDHGGGATFHDNRVRLMPLEEPAR
ncbi:molybdopterin-dependent oxidoreductase [Kineosporia sp. A_224]|uniref:molybdopterin-containing oxidoreductase family protein n=1 Tax=Kineosporia sp. A_224 TaxID=1962180 RepID=UPI000B4B3D1F|nr:molybdopterin-dependent oxidoreductase [Kineosporia sp. A_224]